MPDAPAPELRLGPLLRHVGPTHATVWVETSRPCTVAVLGFEQPTFTVAGHHYALVVVRGLAPGSTTRYDVRLDGEPVWPLSPAAGIRTASVFPARFPPSTIRTPCEDSGGTLRIAWGSCRYARPPAPGSADSFGPCALDALARDLVRTPDAEWPDLLLLLGDQVYADETTPAIRERIRRRRGDGPPRHQASDYEEYTWLYEESWTDPEVRWLYSVVPTAMIFDDHDVHDDWNTSRSWRQDLQATSWWAERIVAALSSYWVYQHLGNLSPTALDAEPTYARIRALPPGADAEPLLRELALAADRESDGAKGYRWSFCRDVGRTRIIVLDSRCGRVLDGEQRAMLGDAEFDWARTQMQADVDHLLVASSVPWLLAPALHDLEAWDERLAADPRPWRARLGERLRRAGDLEHWAAFSESFHRLSGLLAEASRGSGAAGRAPASVAVLGGDVHHSYVAQARLEALDPAAPDQEVRGPAAPVHQLTCSPLHNSVPRFIRLGLRISWSTATECATRTLLRHLARVPPPHTSWRRTCGPFFGNALGLIRIDGRRSEFTLLTSEPPKQSGDDDPQLRPLYLQPLSRP